jgi:uncharacterized DUF497 family protein
MGLYFEWNTHKAAANISKHGISFDEASTAFADVFSVTIADPVHSEEEDRYILLGLTHRNRIIVVVHSERGERIRIISARKATSKERRLYESKEH